MSSATWLALSSGSSSVARLTLMNSPHDKMDSARKNIISGALSRSSVTASVRRRRWSLALGLRAALSGCAIGSGRLTAAAGPAPASNQSQTGATSCERTLNVVSTVSPASACCTARSACAARPLRRTGLGRNARWATTNAWWRWVRPGKRCSAARVARALSAIQLPLGSITEAIAASQR